MTCQELSFALGEVEPYFCSMTIFDISTNERISETFSFDFQTDVSSVLLGVQSVLSIYRNFLTPQDKLNAITKSKNAIFQLKETNPNFNLIFTVEKVLQGEIDDVIENYVKANQIKKEKKNKIVDEARIFCNMLGNYKQLLCWGVLPLFPEVPATASLELVGAKNEITGPGNYSEKEYKVGEISRKFLMEKEIKSDSRQMCVEFVTFTKN